MTQDEEFWSSSKVANFLGIKPESLRKRRVRGVAPFGWKRVGPTRVVYPKSSVLALVMKESPRVH